MSTTDRLPLTEVANSESVRLADDPNVDSVGFGLRRRGGTIEYEVCILYIVRQKVADRDEIRALGSEPIAAEVGGYPTDVRPSEVFRAVKNEGPPTGSRGSHIEDPLMGGLSTTVLSDWHSFPTGFGTIGGLCFDAADGTPLALSNAHVWGLDAGKDCIQPWIPTGEYLEAVAKLLTCGPAAFVLDTIVPSPLTAGLAAAATAAWIAAAASDAEDPSRWGQRVGPAPAAGALTTAETIRVAAPVPDFPFAGRAYTTKARWDHTRHTTAGDLSSTIEQGRPNEHVLLGKLVWTDRGQYQSGQRVQICADVITDRVADPSLYHVVAVCYPESDPGKVVYRVLRPGRCKEPYEGRPICLDNFPDPMPWSDRGSGYTAHLDPFYVSSDAPIKVTVGAAGSPLAGRPLLALGAGPVRVVFPPSTAAEFEVVQPGAGVRLSARNSAGRIVATATGTGGSASPETLTLSAPEMVEAVIDAADDGAALAALCVVKRPGQTGVEAPTAATRVHHLPYTGVLDLGLRESKARWNIVLQVQSLDPSGVATDPVAAAGLLGGITASTNVVGVACATIMLLDHVFDVI